MLNYWESLLACLSLYSVRLSGKMLVLPTSLEVLELASAIALNFRCESSGMIRQASSHGDQAVLTLGHVTTQSADPWAY